jgi:hypothetical protein
MNARGFVFPRDMEWLQYRCFVIRPLHESRVVASGGQGNPRNHSNEKCGSCVLWAVTLKGVLELLAVQCIRVSAFFRALGENKLVSHRALFGLKTFFAGSKA